MRNKAFTFWQAVALLAAVAVLAAIFFPIFGRSRGSDHGPTCQSNLKQIGLGLGQYAQDYDDKFPPVASDQGGWADIIQPYTKSRSLFHCPVVNGDRSAATSDYFYNARLAGVYYLTQNKAGVIMALAPGIIMVGDGTPDSPTNSNLRALPASWRTDSGSPAARHFGMANYLFVDGHVKALKTGEIEDGTIRKMPNSYSFAVR